MSKFNIILLRACFQFSSQGALGPKQIEVLQLLTTHWVAHCDDFTSYFNLFYHNPREKKWRVNQLQEVSYLDENVKQHEDTMSLF